jgi:drug/metabolite transporter (DMT)-like permease
VKRLWLIAMLLLATAVWGWTFPVMKDAVDKCRYGVVAFLAIRFAIGSTLLGAAAVRQFKRRSLLIGGGIGIVLALGYFCQTAGLRQTTATNSGFITGLFVVTTPIINRLLFGVKIRPTFWAAVAVSLVGLYLLTNAGRARFGGGDWLTLAAAVLYGLHIALLDRFAKGHPPLLLAFAQTASSAMLFFLLLPVSEPMRWPSREVWFDLAITGVLATAACFAIQTYVQQRLSAVASTLILSAEPVFAAMFGCLLLDERLSAVQMLGMTLMIGAMLAAQIGAGEHASSYPLDPL